MNNEAAFKKKTNESQDTLNYELFNNLTSQNFT